MNNEWNDEVVVDVSESDITVDQTYDATSSNPQSGTAVAQAVAQAGGTVDQQYNASSTNAQSGTAVAGAIAGVKQVPASTSADATKVLTVNSEGVPGWATAQGGGGGVPVLHTLVCQKSMGTIQGELPEGEYLEPGLYQVFLSFAMSEYDGTYRLITYGYQAEHSEWIPGHLHYPAEITSTGPFSSSEATFMRTGYIKVEYPNEVSGLNIVFKTGTSQALARDVLNNITVQYLKIGDLS